jgi:hypothetical protein
VDHLAPHKTVEVARRPAEHDGPSAMDNQQHDFAVDAETGIPGTTMQTSAYDDDVRRSGDQIRGAAVAVEAADDEVRGVGPKFAANSEFPAEGGKEADADVAFVGWRQTGSEEKWMAQ